MIGSATRLVLFTACAVLAGCSGGDAPDPEAEIRTWINEMQEYAEAKERRSIIANISENYADWLGNGRNDVEDILRIYFLRQNSIALLTSIDEIRLLGDSAAEVSLTVGMAGTQDGGLGFSADAYDFELELERDDEEWRLISAKWGAVGSQLY